MKKLISLLVIPGFALASASVMAAGEPVIGLITKTETNPFFVKMKAGAEAEAKKLGAKLLTAAGKADGDTAGQITALGEHGGRWRQNHSDHSQRRRHRAYRQKTAGQRRSGDRAG